MMLQIRPATEADRAAAAGLAPRLEEGVAAWRDQSAVAAAVRGWVDSALDGVGDEQRCFVAEQAGTVVGFVSVSETQHWSGDRDAYIGELMVVPDAEGRGIGRALVETASSWARARGCRRIGLETGAANLNARRFYESLAFEEEDVRLSRAL